ncbi:MAG: TonB-dependent receptor [Deltaproteobacteria bacterium]|nr:TonB-dependent receptor [Deltaproteobacteria bacterium]
MARRLDRLRTAAAVPAALVFGLTLAAPARAQLPVAGEEEIEVIAPPLRAAEVLGQSAAAVEVIAVAQAQRESADLGEVLARTRGVGVRRAGGLGSLDRFSLDGFTDDQIRFFVDEVPLELAGFALGLANVPVDLVERAEIYRGVVPARFGTDALGGAVNLVTEPEKPASGAGTSYQVGSFGTHRVTADGRYHDPEAGLVGGATGFFDDAGNDYPIHVEVADDTGALVPATVRRFHDAYRAGGGTFDLGVVDRPWADRATARIFTTSYDKELQHNVVMTVPYGEVTYGEQASGGTLRFARDGREHGDPLPFALDVLAGYAYRAIDFEDRSPWVYDWHGDRVRERVTPGETGGAPADQTTWEHAGLARLAAALNLAPGHELRLVTTPSYATRWGRDRIRAANGTPDPLTAERALFTVVSGIEEQADLLDGDLENVAFVKHYRLSTRAEPGPAAGAQRVLEHDLDQLGGGDALRWWLGERLRAKASYEYATRLPRADELFGDGVLVQPNLALDPEVSHNLNLGVALEPLALDSGDYRAELGGIARFADQLVVLVGTDRDYSYQNVYAARILGVDGALGFRSPAAWSDWLLGAALELDGNATYQDARNVSSRGTFGTFEGDRIPNRPWLFVNGAARLEWRELVCDDVLSLGWYGRYVHEFYRGWESIGRRDTKQVVPSQLTHTLTLGYWLHGGGALPDASLSFEVQNLTDERAYDFFGVERPGRSFALKVTAWL